ncbi:MAG: sulfotransferase [Candidatus Binataceae bacterium]
MHDDHAGVGAGGAQLFVVIGAQRSGTNILREILNTNENIGMLGEVFSPSAAPAHWENFCRALPAGRVRAVSVGEAETLLDQYFDFVLYRVRNHWEGNKKARSRAIGVDIKYNQLRQIVPSGWHSTAPFILCYLRSRNAILIHATRNVIHCAISVLIASEREFWHNYNGAVIDRTYHIDAEECLAHARTILHHRDAFTKFASGCTVVDSRYECLMEDLERAGFGEEIPDGPGPLMSIASALGSPFRFSHDRRLQRAINVPYSRLISNYEVLIRRLIDSEFSSLSTTLA